MAFLLQKKPALQNPEGVLKPSVAQNLPESQGVHSVEVFLPVPLLYVPAGHLDFS
jgi:hypothetical protein